MASYVTGTRAHFDTLARRSMKVSVGNGSNLKKRCTHLCMGAHTHTHTLFLL